LILKRLVFILFIPFSLTFYSQEDNLSNLEKINLDTSILHSKFYKTQENAMKILGGWSLINIASSPFLKTTSIESWPHFHQMNFNWNLVNISIAGFGYLGIKKRKEKYWSLSSLETEQNKLKKSLALNMGLDACYIIAGCLLKNRVEKLSTQDQARNIGFGNSLMLQGGFLLAFDAVFVLKISGK
jgi:hypothetical protein